MIDADTAALATIYGSSTHIDAHIAAVTLHYYVGSEHQDVAVPPSEWRLQLIRLITKSDMDNRCRLARAFPGQVAACCLIEWHAEGVSLLRDAIANDEILAGIFDTPPFTCPKCQATSYNPNDLAQGYCGRCHEYTGKDASRIPNGSTT